MPTRSCILLRFGRSQSYKIELLTIKRKRGRQSPDPVCV